LRSSTARRFFARHSGVALTPVRTEAGIRWLGRGIPMLGKWSQPGKLIGTAAPAGPTLDQETHS